MKKLVKRHIKQQININNSSLIFLLKIPFNKYFFIGIKLVGICNNTLYIINKIINPIKIESLKLANNTFPSKRPNKENVSL